MAPEISVLIHTRDSAASIGRCLASVAWCNDVVVLDMASTDDTCAIAVAAGARVVAIPAEPWSDAIRNRHLGEAAHPWTLVLDSDESLADDGGLLVEALVERLGADIDAFALPRVNTVAGRVMRGTGFAPDHQWRLFRTGSLAYSAAHHQPPVFRDGYHRLHVVDPAAGPCIHHEHYGSLRDLVLRQARYAATDAYDPDAFDLGAYTERVHRELAQRHDPEADGDLSRAIATVMAWDGVVRALLHWESLEPRPRLGDFLALPVGLADGSSRAQVGQRAIAEPAGFGWAPSPGAGHVRQRSGEHWTTSGAEHALRRAWAAHRVHRYQETIIVRRALHADIGIHSLDEVIAERPAAAAAATPVEGDLARTRTEIVQRALRRSTRRRLGGGGVYPIPPLRGLAWRAEGRLDASIIIPFHEQFELTLQCLEAASTTSVDRSLEIIVVDDGSALDRSDVFAGVPGVEYVRLDERTGFVGAVNAGAARARGDAIVLLNNDTVPQRGWLGALLDALAADEEIGVVGALLLRPDGYVAEAGGLLGRDGAPQILGTGLASDDPAIGASDVDYVSGACLAIRREVWDAVGGFDGGYAPAYFEDADLCLAIRARGLRVRVEPSARVIHLGGQSYGTDGDAAKDVLMALGRRRLLRKWGGELARRADLVPAAARKRARSIVVCNLQLPRDDLEGGSTRMRGIVRALLADDWDVVFAALDGDETSPVADDLRAEGCRVVAGLDGIVAALPRPPQAMLLSRPEVFGAFALHLKGTWPQSALIYDTVDLHADRVRAQHARRGIEAEGFADVVASFEQAAFTASDLVLAVSEDEAHVVRERAPGSETALVPVLYRVTGHPAPRSARHGMAFIGGYRHVPNVDAALRLGTQVFPRVRAANAEETLTIAGAFPPHDVVALAQQPGIGVCGWVDDIDEFHGTHVALVAPIEWGAGINSKIVAALAAGLPVVTTPFGATGLGAVAGEHLLVGETDAELAELYLRVATDQALWQRLADAGQALVRERFEPAVAVAPLLQWLEQQRGSEPHTDATSSTIVRV